MIKSLMIPMQPQQVADTLNGKKTLELRTWIPKGYIGWVYVCVPKVAKDFLYKYKDEDEYYTQRYLTFTDDIKILNGKVAFRFWFDDYETFEYKTIWGESDYISSNGVDSIGSWRVDGSYLDNLCLDYQDVLDYGFREKPKPHQKTLYAWYIKQLEIFDAPKELSDFYELYSDEGLYPLTKAPKRSAWVYVRSDINYKGLR